MVSHNVQIIGSNLTPLLQRPIICNEELLLQSSVGRCNKGVKFESVI